MAIVSRYAGLYVSPVGTCRAQCYTTPQEGSVFPASVVAECNFCGKKHPFNFQRHFVVNTPSQQESFRKHCVDKGIKTEVEIR